MRVERRYGACGEIRCALRQSAPRRGMCNTGTPHGRSRMHATEYAYTVLCARFRLFPLPVSRFASLARFCSRSFPWPVDPTAFAPLAHPVSPPHIGSFNGCVVIAADGTWTGSPPDLTACGNFYWTGSYVSVLCPSYPGMRPSHANLCGSSPAG